MSCAAPAAALGTSERGTQDVTAVASRGFRPRSVFGPNNLAVSPGFRAASARPALSTCRKKKLNALGNGIRGIPGAGLVIASMCSENR
jgi:hypothetical protein